MVRIELTLLGPKPRVIPFHHTEFNWCPHRESNSELMLTRQLLYHLTIGAKNWWWWRESSPQPLPYEGNALPLCYITMAPKAGIEPTTNWLTVNCTTAVLLWNKNLAVSRGNDPLLLAWQASVRPWTLWNQFGGDDRDRTYCDLSRKIYSLLPYHYGGISKFYW